MKTTTLTLLLAVTLGASAGCESDQTRPEIIGIRAEVDGEAVAEIEPQDGTDTTISEDVPVSSALVVEFSEPIDLASAREKITLEDADGNLLDVTISARLGEVTITPATDMLPMLNHTLNIEKGVEDTSGQSVTQSLRINFYTAEEEMGGA